MAKKSNKRKCDCWSCRLTPKIKRFDKSLTAGQHKVFREIFDEIWNHLESDSMELGVVNSKIEGTWPRENGEPYYHRVGNTLFEVIGKPVE